MALSTRANPRPNIVFILADNVGWGDLSCYGGGTPTPRIDKLAARQPRRRALAFDRIVVEADALAEPRDAPTIAGPALNFPLA